MIIGHFGVGFTVLASFPLLPLPETGVVRVPGWSSEIADEFLRMGATEGKAFTQMHLQDLVYIAHGWCLALTGEPLTGDRPEALEHGPEYRRLANAFWKSGIQPIAAPFEQTASRLDTNGVDDAFNAAERAIVAKVYFEYGKRPTAELGVLTRADDTPWHQVYAGGEGKGRDIAHRLIRDQFAKLAAPSN